MSTNYIVQTVGGRAYTELFAAALQHGPYARLRCAVAYATVGGVRTLEATLQPPMGPVWDQLEKRWLIGIDWCRSDPPALNRLQGFQRSEVRVPQGASLVASPGCTPRLTYHPKLFVFSGPRTNAIICGSGNLSANGLTRGCECGSLHLIETGRGHAPSEEFDRLAQWFDATWGEADRYDSIKAQYELITQGRARNQALVPTDDDSEPPAARQQRRSAALTEEQIRQLRTFDNFWIEAGALGANLGRNVPGNQLDMKRFSRAFFGARIEDLEPNTEIDHVTLVWDGELYRDRTLKFGDNGMDKLNVPPVGHREPNFYRNKTLLFTRIADGRFAFTAGAAPEARDWRHKSNRRGALGTVGRREWGVF